MAFAQRSGEVLACPCSDYCMMRLHPRVVLKALRDSLILFKAMAPVVVRCFLLIEALGLDCDATADA